MPTVTKLLNLLSISFPLRNSTINRLRHYRLPLLSASSAAASYHGRLQSCFFLPKLGSPFTLANQTHTHAIAKEGPVEELRSFPGSESSHPWPEWSSLVDLLLSKDYSSSFIVSSDNDDSFSAEELPEDFLKAAKACLRFASARPDILRLLSKKNLETLVMNGSPALFKNGDDSAYRMRSYLTGEGSSAIGTEMAQTVDIMRYLLSYIHDTLSSSDDSNMKADAPTETSVRKLLVELFNLSGTVWTPRAKDKTQMDPPSSKEQLSLPPGQNFELKSGDWICPKCTFVNFAKNVHCLECHEAQPKRQLTGAEWECPQCNFHNYGRTFSCLRCNFKRPGGDPSNSTSTVELNASSSTEQQIFSRRETNYPEVGVEYDSKVIHCDNSTNNAPVLRSLGGPLASEFENQRMGAGHFNFSAYGQDKANQEHIPAAYPSSQTGGNSAQRSTNSLGHGNTADTGFPEYSSQAPSNSGSYHSISTRYTSNSTQSSFTTWRDINASNGGSWGHGNTADTGFRGSSSQAPSNSGSYYSISTGYTSNSTQPSSVTWRGSNASNGGSWGHGNTPYSGFTASSSPEPSNLYSNHSIPTGYTSNSSHPSNITWRGGNASCDGFTADSSQPPKNPSLQAPNNSWNGCFGVPGNSTQQYNSCSNTSVPYGGYSSHPPDPWKNHNTKNLGDSTQPSSNSWANSNTSYNVPTMGRCDNTLSNSTPYYCGSAGNSSESCSNSHAGYSVKPIQHGGSNLGNDMGTPFGRSIANSSQQPPELWSNHKTACNGHTAKLTEPSSNSWSSSHTSLGESTANTAQPHRVPWNQDSNYAADHTPGSWNSSNTCVAASTNSSLPPTNSWNYNNGYHGYASNTDQQPRNTWNSNITSGGGSENPFQLSSNAHNDDKVSRGSEFTQQNNVTDGSVMHSGNVPDCGRLGYSGKSLEGSCVKDTDPLDMSEEAKAERWFRRVAQIKDISELSQIPDEDFPQIMPMRKGVNRFVVSKRKTPLERRLASQQYRRNLPVVSSEPEEMAAEEDKS